MLAGSEVDAGRVAHADAFFRVWRTLSTDGINFRPATLEISMKGIANFATGMI